MVQGVPVRIELGPRDVSKGVFVMVQGLPVRNELGPRDISKGVFVMVQGVPVRIELGPRDVSKGVFVMVRRDTGDKITVKLDEAADSLKKLLEDIHEAMFAKYVDAF